MPKETITCGKCGNSRQIVRIKKEMLGKSFWCEVCRKPSDPMPAQLLSKCHGATLSIASSDEGTSFYYCEYCGQPSDPVQDEVKAIALELVYQGSLLPRGKTISADMFPEQVEAINRLIREARINTYRDVEEAHCQIPAIEEVMKYGGHLRGRMDEKLDLKDWLGERIAQLTTKGDTNGTE